MKRGDRQFREALDRFVVFAAAALLFLGAGNELRIRPPVAAGVFYPAQPDQLRAAVEQYLSSATPLDLPGPAVGCVVPHSPYPVAGAVMGEAFRQLEPGRFDRVIILAPAMGAEFRGCSVPSLQYYRTPLGDVEIDAPAVRRICVNSLIQIRGLVYRREAYTSPQIGRTALHERETSIEVVLPFLQARLGKFKLVPILVSKLEKVTGAFDEHGFDTVVNTLNAIVDDRTLIVACSDLTRYGSQHNYTPFTRNILENISRLDMQAIDLIRERRVKAFDTYLEQSQNTITAPLALCILMRLMPENSGAVLTGYDLSGRITGNPRTSVSFASIVFFDGMHERSGTRRPPVRITDGVRDRQRAGEPAPQQDIPSDDNSGES